ncbi:hypothetical protein SERLA73DRAFT_68169 [Serpula lacrymans var. lacrymans S7.3]|uniref:Uncharacterized protein n=1 Tax=Serpula lacrymans var. lacrymans (strain S7.3) TaxID=936435 RepID=F8PHA2_SERL3|nr:hypothetical protein SERLA73DRAFT_68169 [Serpula lacrymans var. lacrymans S7.3]
MVWAAAILKGDATLEKIPTGSLLFKAKQALKVHTLTEKRPPPSPAAKATTAPLPSSMQFPYFNPSANPLAFSPFVGYNPLTTFPMGFGMPMGGMCVGMGVGMGAGMCISPGMSMGMGMHGVESHFVRSSPQKEEIEETNHLSTPLIESCSLLLFCEPYKLGEDVKSSLDWLGFMVGDNLEAVTEKQHREAGFKPLAWARILKAYHRYKKNHHI